jgi:heme-degrading monooxygenase HmoA
VMVSRWQTRAHFAQYMRSREHKVSHDRIDPDLDAAIRLERLEHLHTYEVVAE